MYNNKKLIVIMLVIAVVSLSVACSREQAEVRTEIVDLENGPKTIEAFGVVRAADTKDIIIEFPAIVEEVKVREGQQVGLEEIIFVLDLNDYLVEINNREKDLAIAMAEKNRIEKGIKGLAEESLELQLDKLNSNLRYAEDSYNYYLRDFETYQRLYDDGGVSKQELTKMQMAVDEMKMKIDDIENSIQQLNQRKVNQNQQLILKKSIEEDQLDIQNKRISQIENQLQLLNNKLNKSYIKDNLIISEFRKGVIYDISYTVGNTTSPSIKAFTIGNLENLTIEANIVEEFINEIEIGANVSIVPIADRSRSYSGRIVDVSRMAFVKNGETVIPIRISIDNPDDFIMPNFNVDVFIEAKK